MAWGSIRSSCSSGGSSRWQWQWQPRSPVGSDAMVTTTHRPRDRLVTALLTIVQLFLSTQHGVLVSGSVVQQKLYGLPTGLAYYVDVQIGQPKTSSTPTTFSLLVDTGSSNTAVVTADCCAATSASLFSCAASATCVVKSQQISVSYITGSWSGELVSDTFSSDEIGTIPNMPFVEIQDESNFIQSGYDGIIGLGYASIASPAVNPPTPYFDVIRSANRTLANVFSMLMCGSLQALLVRQLAYTDALYSGELLLGGTTGARGEKYHQNDLVYTPLVHERWYTVITTGIKVGDDQLAVHCKDINTPRTIIDSGTSNMAFPSAVYTAILDDLRAKVREILPQVGDSFFSDSVPCCASYCDPTDTTSTIFALPSLTISLALRDATDSRDATQQISVTVPPEYLWRPLMLHTPFGVQKCRVFGISEGDVTLLGDVFMDGLFTVHDRESQRMGLGVAASCPNGVRSSKAITVEPLSSAGSSASFCDCVASADRQSSLVSSFLPFVGNSPCFFWLWWMYVVLASALLMLLSLGVVVYVCVQRRQFRRETRRRRFARQQETSALNRNLLATPQCGDGSPPPRALASAGAETTSSASRPSNSQFTRCASSSSDSSISSDVQLDVRSPHSTHPRH